MYFKSGKEEFNFKFKYRSMRELEYKSGMPVHRFMKEDNLGFDAMNLFIWAGLIHDNKKLTQNDVDEIIEGYFQSNEDSSLEDLIKLAMEAFEKSGFGAKKKKIQEIKT